MCVSYPAQSSTHFHPLNLIVIREGTTSKKKKNRNRRLPAPRYEKKTQSRRAMVICQRLHLSERKKQRFINEQICLIGMRKKAYQ